MARVFYVHWNKGEALDSVRSLRAAGHVVRCHADCGPQACAFLEEWNPDLLIVSLAKLPMDGPHWTSMVKAAAAFASVPIIFAGGNEERVTAAKQHFPWARFASFEELIGVTPQVAGPGNARDARIAAG